MTEHVEEGQGAQPSLQEIIDKKPIADFTEDAGREQAHQQAREEREKPPERQQKRAPQQDEDTRFRGLLNETLSEREKRQAAERRAEQLERIIQEHNASLRTAEEQEDAPDMFKDPVAYNNWVKRQIQQQAKALAESELAPLRSQVSQSQIDMSAMRTQSKLGTEKWNKLNEWITRQQAENPRFAQFERYALNSGDPYGVTWQEYRRQMALERLGEEDDLDTFLEKQKQTWLAEQRQPARIAEQSDEEEDFDEPQQSRARMPRTFAAGRSAEPTTAGRAAHAGPKPLGEILRDRPARSQRGR